MICVLSRVFEWREEEQEWMRHQQHELGPLHAWSIPDVPVTRERDHWRVNWLRLWPRACSLRIRTRQREMWID